MICSGFGSGSGSFQLSDFQLCFSDIIHCHRVTVSDYFRGFWWNMPMLSNTIDHLAQALLLTCILNELTFVSAHFVSCQNWSYLKWACFRNVLLPALFLDGGFIFHWSPWAFDPLDPVDTPLNIQLFLSSGFCARTCMVRSTKEKKCLKLDIPQTVVEENFAWNQHYVKWRHVNWACFLDSHVKKLLEAALKLARFL